MRSSQKTKYSNTLFLISRLNFINDEAQENPIGKSRSRQKVELEVDPKTKTNERKCCGPGRHRGAEEAAESSQSGPGKSVKAENEVKEPG